MRNCKSERHGWFEINVFNRVIILKCHSTWNKETAQDMCAQFRLKAASLIDEPWVCSIDLSDWQLAGSEILEPVFALNKWCNKNKQSVEDVVCKLEVQRYVIEHVQSPLTQSSIAFFNEFEQATDWLRGKGFDLSSAPQEAVLT